MPDMENTGFRNALGVIVTGNQESESSFRVAENLEPSAGSSI